MANNTIRRFWNQYSMVNIEDLRGSAFQAEDGGHTFEITGLDANGNATAISGTVAAVFIRPDNTDVAIAGSVSNGKAYVTLTDECYGYPGRFGLTVFLTSGGQKVAIYAAIGNVHRTSSGSVSPETAADVVDLINEIEAAIAQIPASYTDIMAAVAPTYSNTALYSFGAYSWHEGKLYRSVVPITTAESWTAAHWELASIGDAVTEIMSAMNQNIIGKPWIVSGAYGGSTGIVPSNYRIRIAAPIHVDSGTVIHFHNGSLYHMIWELSSASTAGGNVITSNSWNNAPAYIVQNTCYVMISFSKTQGGESQTIAVSDFLDYYSVEIEKTRTTASSVMISDMMQELKLLKNFNFNLLDPSLFESGYYSHTDPYTITSGSGTKHIPPVRIYAGITYYFKNVYAYFSPILYDDGTISVLSNSSSPATVSVSLTPSKNGYVYVTVNDAYTDSAMIVEGSDGGQGYFTGFSGAVTSFNKPVTPTNYQTVLPDWKKAPANSVFSIVSTTAMVGSGTGLWDDVPIPLYRGQCILSLATIGNPEAVGCVQVAVISNKGLSYTRYLNSGSGGNYWTGWYATGSNRNGAIIIDKNGGGDFTSFTEGILYATQFMDSRVYVMPGTYDIISEYEDLYGNDFFTNYTSSATNKGVVLTNDIVVEFAPNAYIVCDYNGNNTYVQNIFSPLNAKQTAGGGGFTLINANVTSRNVRYAMHDERNQSADYYHNKYIGCHFNHDKESGSGYRQCIGGGLGKNGLIEIENCIFENPSDTGNIVSYHNCKSSGARSQVFIRNSFVKGGVRFSYYGESTLVSTMMINGCKMYSQPVVTQESQDYSTVNVEILACGNTVGNP